MKRNLRIITIQNGHDLEIHEFRMPDDVEDEYDLIHFHLFDNGHCGEYFAKVFYKDFFEDEKEGIMSIINQDKW
jgi:hypothetical protein